MQIKFDLQGSERARKTHFNMKGYAQRLQSQKNSEMPLS